MGSDIDNTFNESLNEFPYLSSFGCLSFQKRLYRFKEVNLKKNKN